MDSEAGASWPPGPIDHARFGGILEGRHDDPTPLEDAVARLNDLGLVRADLEIDGGRYSLMLDDRRVPGRNMSDAALSVMLDCLGDVVESSGHSGTAESTLHCSEFARGMVRETLFVPQGGRMNAVSRVRLLADGPDEPDPGSVAQAFRSVGTRRAVWIAVALVVAFGITAWKSGYLDRVLSRDADRINLDTGPFGSDLAVSLESSWGNYEVTVRRGATYPTTGEEIARRREQAPDLAQRAALGILSEGGTIYVQLRDGSRTVLVSERVELRPLLSSADAEVKVTLDGRIAARTVRLDLERGRNP